MALRNALGADLRAQGDFAGAKELDDETANACKMEFGPENGQTLSAMHNLALDYTLTSDYVTARKLHQRTYLEQRATGTPAIEVLISWNALARALRLCGDYSAARDVGEEAYDYGRQLLGAEHYWTLRTARELSIAMRFTATDPDGTLDLAQEVFSRCTRLFGDSHADTLAAAVSQANTQRVMGRATEALALAETTVARYPLVYGANHPFAYGCIGNFAVLRRISGSPTEARRLNEYALAGLDAKLSRDHHYSLAVAANLASDLAALGEITAAVSIGEDTLARLKALLGPDHPVTLSCAVNLATDQRAVGAEEAAEQLLTETLARYQATLGLDHPEAMTGSAGVRCNFDFDPPEI